MYGVGSRFGVAVIRLLDNVLACLNWSSGNGTVFFPHPPAPYLQRPTASSAWVAAPAAPQLHMDGDAEDEGQAEALNEHQLAKVDPLSGVSWDSACHVEALAFVVW